MTGDIYEPLTGYRDALKEQHARHTAAFFEDLARRSGVDAVANAATVAEIHNTEESLGAAERRKSRLKTWRGLTIAAVVVCLIGVLLYLMLHFGVQGGDPPVLGGAAALSCLAGAVGGILLISRRLNGLVGAVETQLSALRERLNFKMHEAGEQMAPLNRLYDWDIASNLIGKTVPRLVLDPYFTCGRLDELRRSFGWDDNFNREKSVLFAQSGAINGNPFVLAETLDRRMIEKTYTGSLAISWQEWESYVDSKGNHQRRLVTRHQTLHASVVKPAPEHTRRKFLVYGNEAAPGLTFSRSPSPLSSAADDFVGRWRKARTIRKLEKLSRNLDDDSGYTVMANREFAALFHATDRNDEIQFRLLFTPLAQSQMVALLKDRTVGYGDNFTFIKSRMINYIYPAHLSELDISAAPSLFHSYDLDAARQFFNDYHNTYFKAFFFTLAPLLTIPLYQQHRSHDDIYKDVYGRTASFWEHEAIANFHGQETFRHPASATPCILKTSVNQTQDGIHTLEVTAHGFGTIERVDYVVRRGGDGRIHEVPVPWVEYVPVSRATPMMIRETEGLTLADYRDESSSNPDWQAFFRDLPAGLRSGAFRRSIISGVIQ